jgi:hypothetical protein
LSKSELLPFPISYRKLKLQANDSIQTYNGIFRFWMIKPKTSGKSGKVKFIQHDDPKDLLAAFRIGEGNVSRMAIIAIDLDEFVVDNSARVARATKPDGKLDWNVMFSAELILELDQPMPEQLARLKELVQKGYQIWYITSRQADKCQEATTKWLEQEGYPFPKNVICRPAFKKTLVFKAEAVRKLHSECSPVVLFADNNTANLEAVLALNIPGLRVSDTLTRALGLEIEKEG